MSQITTYSALVGQSLAWARQMAGLDQSALAQHVGVGQSTWSKIERGESALNVEQLERAATRLGTTPSQILNTADVGAAQLRHQGIHIASSKLDAVSPTMAVLSIAVLALLIAGIMRAK